MAAMRDTYCRFCHRNFIGTVLASDKRHFSFSWYSVSLSSSTKEVSWNKPNVNSLKNIISLSTCRWYWFAGNTFPCIRRGDQFPPVPKLRYPWKRHHRMITLSPSNESGNNYKIFHVWINENPSVKRTLIRFELPVRNGPFSDEEPRVK